MTIGKNAVLEYRKTGELPKSNAPYLCYKFENIEITPCKTRDMENLAYEEKLKDAVKKEKEKQKTKCKKVCDIIKECHDDLKDDPNSLSTKFIRDLIMGDRCVR